MPHVANLIGRGFRRLIRFGRRIFGHRTEISKRNGQRGQEQVNSFHELIYFSVVVSSGVMENESKVPSALALPPTVSATRTLRSHGGKSFASAASTYQIHFSPSALTAS